MPGAGGAGTAGRRRGSAISVPARRCRHATRTRMSNVGRRGESFVQRALILPQPTSWWRPEFEKASAGKTCANLYDLGPKPVLNQAIAKPLCREQVVSQRSLQDGRGANRILPVSAAPSAFPTTAAPPKYRCRVQSPERCVRMSLPHSAMSGEVHVSDHVYRPSLTSAR